MIRLTFTLMMTTARVVETLVTLSTQWWIQGRDPGDPPQPLYLRVWMTAPPPLSEGLDLPLQQ